MAKVNESTLKYKADISELKSAMQEAKTSIARAKSEFDKSTESLDNWRKSSEGVEAKLKQLNSTLSAQNKVLDNYREQLARTVDEFGEGSVQAEQLREKIEKQKSTISKTKSEISKFEKSLKEVSEAEALAEKEGISLDEAFQKLKKSASDAGEEVEEASEGFTVMKGAIASLVAEGIKSFISGIANAIAETAEFRNELAMLEATANTTGTGFDKASEKLKEIATITKDTGAGVEAVNNLMSAGFKGENLDELTEQLLGASIKWKDTLKMEGLADGLQETLATGKGVGPFAELLERGGKNLEEFDKGLAKMTTDAERQQYVLEQLKDLGLKPVLDEYKENNKYMLMNAEASYSFQESMSQIATTVEPVIASVKQGFADILTSVLGLGNVNTEGIAEKISGVFSTIKQLISGEMSVESLMSMGADWLKNISEGLVQNIPLLAEKGLTILEGFTGKIRENAPNVVKAGLGLIENLVQGIMNSLPTLISKVPTIVSNIANVINDNAPTILKSAFNIVVTIVKGIISAIPTLVQNIPKIISAIVDVWSAFNWINLGKTAFTKLGDGIKSMTGWLKTKATDITTGISNVVRNLPTTLMNIGKSAMSGLGNAISGAVGTVKTSTTKIFDAVVNGVKGLPDKMLGIGKDLVKGLWNGISDMTGWIIDKLQGFGDNVLSGIKNFFGIKSPSTMMRDEVGKFLAEGIGEGFTGQMSKTVKDMKSSLGSVTNSITPTLTGASSGGNVTNNTGTTNNFYQTINSPKQLSRLEIYRQSRNLLNYQGV